MKSIYSKNNRIDLIERYLKEKHNYSLDEIVEISNRMLNLQEKSLALHSIYLSEALSAEVYKIEGTINNLDNWIEKVIEEEEEILNEILD